MKIEIVNGRYWYENMVGQQFNVVEKFDSLCEKYYFIKGKENERKSNWFVKSDCKIISKTFLKAFNILEIDGRLEYYNKRLAECREDYNSYEKGIHKEDFKGQNKFLAWGALCNMQKLEGKIEVLKSIKGIV